MSTSLTPELLPEPKLPLTPEPEAVPARGMSPGRAKLAAFLRHRGTWIGGSLLVMFLLMAALAPLLAPYDPLAVNADLGLSAPSWAHPMGTDDFGRDILSRVIHGSRLSLIVGFSCVAISAAVGTLIGLLAGYFRGPADSVLMRVMDVLLAFPGLVLALALAAVMGRGTLSVIVAVGVAGVPTFARVTRGAVLGVVNTDYVLAARAVGCRSTWILRRHILPNVVAPVIVMTTLYLAYAVLYAASISFLGVGVQPPTAEWGAMTNAGRGVLVQGWWVSTFPSLMIMLFVLSVNVMGDSLRDALDSKLRRS